MVMLKYEITCMKYEQIFLIFELTNSQPPPLRSPYIILQPQKVLVLFAFIKISLNSWNHG